jgi:hypothetical protein
MTDVVNDADCAGEKYDPAVTSGQIGCQLAAQATTGAACGLRDAGPDVDGRRPAYNNSSG